jgi:hypothetical protein
MHSTKFHCILFWCIPELLHAHAFICISTYSCRLHSGTMHWCAFTCITFVASQCIQYLVHLDALLCIYNTMHFHPLLHYLAFGDVMHSCALPYVCILYVMHISAFRCMCMRCILMHSNYDAFMCINSYSSSWRRNNAWFGCATRGAKIAWYLLHDCFMMRENA